MLGPSTAFRDQAVYRTASSDAADLFARELMASVDMRQVEVSVIMFREDLEDQGLSKEELEEQVAEHRAKLVAAAEKAPDSKAEASGSGSKHRKADKAKESSSKGREREAGKERTKSSR